MTPEEFLKILSQAGKLKTTLRHCWLEPERRESVADHCWRLALMAMLLADEPDFADVDMNRVIRMCLIHDLGESFTGDIPVFQKADSQEHTEESLLREWFGSFPEPQRGEWLGLLAEMIALESREAQTYKALDALEALISHDESDIATWLPLEYDLQLTYRQENMKAAPFFEELRACVDAWTRAKIAGAVAGADTGAEAMPGSACAEGSES